MPDWTYQTVFRPALFRLRPESARNFALGAMGRLSSLPLGRRVIQFMGHMKADRRLHFERHGLELSSRVGLGCAFDSELVATSALSEFGFGYIEIGPVISKTPTKPGRITIDVANESIGFEEPMASVNLSTAIEKLGQPRSLNTRIVARLHPESTSDFVAITAALEPHVAAFTIPADSLIQLERNTDISRPLLVIIDADHWSDEIKRAQWVAAFHENRIVGFWIEPTTAPVQYSLEARRAVLETVESIQSAVGDDAIVIASAGIHSPADALDAIDAGADLVQVDSGLVFAGPGLPKRINEAVLYRQLASQSEESQSTRLGNQSWFWAMLMGISMFVGGLLAMAVATTRVVLPYDESMAGLTRDQLADINDRLLSFMTHDRVTLAGTMLAVGILYVTMAWYGIRRGVHWAQASVMLSALAGFVSFFSFLGFGYFDPFHAFVTAILFQFLLLTFHSRLPERHALEPPDLWNDARWKRSQWGQLSFVIHGAVLIVAGLVISSVGMTSVFVKEDLEFMRTTADALFGAHPQLVPLIAHDRATFGGMLIACGVATFLPALWGFRRGHSWLWWALMSGGSIAYISTILVHWVVGYDSLHHLLPAYGGLGLLWIGGIASYSHLAGKDRELELEWSRRINAARELNG